METSFCFKECSRSSPLPLHERIDCSFLLLSGEVCMDMPQTLHSPDDRLLGCFQFGAKIAHSGPLVDIFSFLLGKHLGTEVFSKNCQSGATTWCSRRQCLRALVATRSPSLLVPSVFARAWNVCHFQFAFLWFLFQCFRNGLVRQRLFCPCLCALPVVTKCHEMGGL